MATRGNSLSLFTDIDSVEEISAKESVSPWIWLLLVLNTAALFATFWAIGTRWMTGNSLLSFPTNAAIGAVLGLGVVLSMVLIHQRNQAGEVLHQKLDRLLLFTGSIVLTSVAMLGFDWTHRFQAHTGNYYLLVCSIAPLILAFYGAVATHRWATTRVTLFYSLFFLLWYVSCIFIQRMSAPEFPLLLIFPAIALDLMRSSPEKRSVLMKSVLNGFVFFGVFLFLQWTFTDFLLSEGSHNRIFGFSANTLTVDLATEPYPMLAWRLLLALVFSMLMTGTGMLLGNCFRKEN